MTPLNERQIEIAVAVAAKINNRLEPLRARARTVSDWAEIAELQARLVDEEIRKMEAHT